VLLGLNVFIVPILLVLGRLIKHPKDTFESGYPYYGFFALYLNLLGIFLVQVSI
jgi:hypothetical protein